MIPTNSPAQQYAGGILSWAGWICWVGLLCLYIAAIVPIYARGLQKLPTVSFEYAGEGKYLNGISQAPVPEEVYGEDWAFLAPLGWTAPPVTFLMLISLFWRLTSRWSSNKVRERGLLAGAAIVTLVAFLFGWNLWEDFFIWGLG